MRRVKGFTLIELMVTLAVAGVLLGIVVSGFSSFLRSGTADVEAASLINSFNYARSEAVRRKSNISVKPAAGGWKTGWNVLDSANTVLQTYSGISSSAAIAPSSAQTITFTPRGTLVDGSTAVTFAYSWSGQCKLDRNISISPMGRVTSERKTCP